MKPIEHEIEYHSVNGRYTHAVHCPTGLTVKVDSSYPHRSNYQAYERLTAEMLTKIAEFNKSEQMTPEQPANPTTNVELNSPVRIKSGWDEAGKQGWYLGGVFCNQPWAVVLWDGDEDPSTVKMAALEVKQTAWTPCISESTSDIIARTAHATRGGGAPKRS